MMARFFTLTVLISSLLSSLSYAGVITTEAGSGTVSGYAGDADLATVALLNAPYDTVLDAVGNLYIADSANNVIRKVNASEGLISTFVSGISAPRGLAVNATDLFVASFNSHQILKINLLSKTVSVIAGDGVAGFFGDGTAATGAQLNGPTGLALDAAGDLYIADAVNHRIRKVALLTGVITTVAGDGDTAVLNYPQDVVFDLSGAMLIADSFNNRVQKVAGVAVTTVVGDGTAATSGDSSLSVVGLAALAQVNNPTGLALDSKGNLYVSEYYGQRVRKISSAGLISTLAGTGVVGFSGDGGNAALATLHFPTGFVIVNDVLHLADTNNNRIRKIALDTIPATVALSIDNNSSHTNQTTLNLSVSCDDGVAGSGCDLMRISEDAGATWTNWQSYAATLSWPLLSTIDGNKNMAVQLLDAEGNVSEASAAIILDTVAPLSAPVITAPVNSSSSKTANNTLSGTAEANSTVEVLLGATTLGLLSANTLGEWSVSHLFTEGQNYSLTAQVTDLAGNVGPTSAATVFTVDLTVPSLVLTGGAVTVQADPASAASYNEQGAVVSDNFDLTLTAATIGGTVNIALPGDYTLTYDATDAAGNAAPQQTRIVTVVDSVKPLITMLGSNITNHEAGAVYTDAGATASDGLDGTITAHISTVNSVDISATGTYSVTYDVSDAAGNAAAQVSRSVAVVDTTSPTITLNGAATVPAEAGLAYVDLGAVASDNAAAAVTLTDDANVVDTAVLAAYTVTYTATDGAGLITTSVRTVNVTDTTLPMITLTGGTAIHVEATSTNGYSDPGFSATDSFDAALSAVTVSGAVPDSSVPSVYNVNYDVSDASGNAALQVVRQVTVSDTTAPLISVAVPAGQTTPTVNVLIGDVYTDVGATALDSFDGAVAVSSDAATVVNTAVAASYTVIYTSTDAAGNVATATRQVNVVSDQPVITLIGVATVSVEAGTTYTDLGATAFDNVDGNISGNVVTVSTVNTAAIGSYTVSYSVSDAAGNAAVVVTRSVNVTDSIAPTLIRNGGDILNLSAGSIYNDAGAVASDTFEGDISASIVVSNPVDTAVPGVYTVFYNVADSSGNAALQARRTVVVLDKDNPVIGITSGVTAVTHEAGNPFVAPAATASDAIDGDLTSAIVLTSTVNEHLPGRYVVIYTVQDSAGNSAQTSVAVSVEDSTSPTLTLIGDAALSIEFGSTYVDAGATASDSVDGNISANVGVVNGVDTSLLGIQSVDYSIVDRAGNGAQLSRTVTVVDSTPPTLTLSANALSLVKGDNYIQPDITAVDAVDGLLDLGNISVTGGVNSNQVGVYTVTVIATDAAGNASAPQTWVVTVVDSVTAPSAVGSLSGWMVVLMLLGLRFRKRA